MKLKSYASYCLTSCPVVFIDSNDEFWLWPRLGGKKLNHNNVALREIALYLVVNFFICMAIVLCWLIQRTAQEAVFRFTDVLLATWHPTEMFRLSVFFSRSIFPYELISRGLFLNNLKDNGPVHALLVSISRLSYRKIPKRRPSMYKPTKLVMQKTLR